MRDTYRSNRLAFCTQLEEISKDVSVRNFSAEMLSRLTPSAEYYLETSKVAKFSKKTKQRKVVSVVQKNWRTKNFDFQNRFRITTRKLNDLIGLAILSWYLPEQIGVLLRMDLLEISKESEDLIVVTLLLNNIEQTRCYLLETSLWHSRDFFGNIYNREIVKHLIKLFKPVFAIRKPPEQVQRHRGYRDKGTLRKVHDRHSFVSFTAEHRELEERRKSLQDSIQLIEGFFAI